MSNNNNNSVIDEVLLDRNFENKLALSSDQLKGYYSIIKNELLAYKNVSQRFSKSVETFKCSKIVLAKFAIVGKTFKLYLALNVEDYNKEKYGQTFEGNLSSFKEVPFMVRIKSDRGLSYAIELIADLMSKNNIPQLEERLEIDYKAVYPYIENAKLKAKDVSSFMAKKLQTDPNEKKSFYDGLSGEAIAISADDLDKLEDDLSDDEIEKLTSDEPIYKTVYVRGGKDATDNTSNEPTIIKVSVESVKEQNGKDNLINESGVANVEVGDAGKNEECNEIQKIDNVDDEKLNAENQEKVQARKSVAFMSKDEFNSFFNDEEKDASYIPPEKDETEIRKKQCEELFNKDNLEALEEQQKYEYEEAHLFELAKDLVESEQQESILEEQSVELHENDNTSQFAYISGEKSNAASSENEEVAIYSTSNIEDSEEEEIPKAAFKAKGKVKQVILSETEDEYEVEVTEMVDIIWLERSFENKLRQSDKELKRNYNEIKNELLSYKNVKSRMSIPAESFKFNKDIICKLNIVGKTIKVYLALDVEAYDKKKYNQQDSGNLSSFKEVPFLLKVRSERSLKHTIELIGELMLKYSTNKIEDYEKEDCLKEYAYVVGGMLKPKDLSEFLKMKLSDDGQPAQVQETYIKRVKRVDYDYQETQNEIDLIREIEEPIGQDAFVETIEIADDSVEEPTVSYESTDIDEFATEQDGLVEEPTVSYESTDIDEFAAEQDGLVEEPTVSYESTDIDEFATEQDGLLEEPMVSYESTDIEEFAAEQDKEVEDNQFSDIADDSEPFIIAENLSEEEPTELTKEEADVLLIEQFQNIERLFNEAHADNEEVFEEISEEILSMFEPKAGVEENNDSDLGLELLDDEPKPEELEFENDYDSITGENAESEEIEEENIVVQEETDEVVSENEAFLEALLDDEEEEEEHNKLIEQIKKEQEHRENDGGEGDYFGEESVDEDANNDREMYAYVTTAAAAQAVIEPIVHYYQPVVDVLDNIAYFKMSQVLQDKLMGVIPPQQYFDIADNSKRINTLNEIALENARETIDDRINVMGLTVEEDEGEEDDMFGLNDSFKKMTGKQTIVEDDELRLSLLFSTQNMLSAEGLDDLMDKLKNYKNNVILNLDFSSIHSYELRGRQIINTLRNEGIRVSLFRSENVSWNAFTEIDCDYVEFDMRRYFDKTKLSGVLSAVLNICKSQGIKTVATYADTKEMLDFAKSNNFDYFTGDEICHPMRTIGGILRLLTPNKGEENG